jgi:hypothetical protein
LQCSPPNRTTEEVRIKTGRRVIMKGKRSVEEEYMKGRIPELQREI